MGDVYTHTTKNHFWIFKLTWKQKHLPVLVAIDLAASGIMFFWVMCFNDFFVWLILFWKKTENFVSKRKKMFSHKQNEIDLSGLIWITNWFAMRNRKKNWRKKTMKKQMKTNLKKKHNKKHTGHRSMMIQIKKNYWSLNITRNNNHNNNNHLWFLIFFFWK